MKIPTRARVTIGCCGPDNGGGATSDDVEDGLAEQGYDAPPQVMSHVLLLMPGCEQAPGMARKGRRGRGLRTLASRSSTSHRRLAARMFASRHEMASRTSATRNGRASGTLSARCGLARRMVSRTMAWQPTTRVLAGGQLCHVMVSESTV